VPAKLLQDDDPALLPRKRMLRGPNVAALLAPDQVLVRRFVVSCAATIRYLDDVDRKNVGSFRRGGTRSDRN
jgi:hypothetical protein